MKQIFQTVLLTCLLTGGSYADGYFGFAGGVQWPQALHSMDGFGSRTAWTLGLDWGGSPSDMVKVGGSFGAQFKRVVNDPNSVFVDDGFSGSYSQYSDKGAATHVMFPLQLNLAIDPLAKLPVHPVIQGGGGPAVMIFSSWMLDSTATSSSSDRLYSKAGGLYWGFIGHIGADCMFNLGKEARIYIGGEYQWCSLYNREWGTSHIYQQDMSGPAIHLGIRVK